MKYMAAEKTWGLMTRPLIFLLMTGTMFSSMAGVHWRKDSENCAITGKTQIVVSPRAGKETRESAERLAGLLGQVTGVTMRVGIGDGSAGIAVGLPGDFPEVSLREKFELDNPEERQGYEIKSHLNGIYIIGATETAVDYAVMDFLGKIGYRRYFPSKNWEILPKTPSLELAGHWHESPDYHYRSIWANYGNWPEHLEDSAFWGRFMRLGGIRINTGHAYDNFIRQLQAEFKQHPEYYALVKGERNGSKLCIGNPELRKLICDYAVNFFSDNPALESFSVEPSDGGGWCECGECVKLGTPSTRAVILANAVAVAVGEKFKDRKIGMYAYAYHSPPPDIDVDPNVVVCVATAFIKGNTSVKELVHGWQKRKANIGIREYYSVVTWSYCLPGRSRGSDLDYIKTSIPEFYQLGARYLSAESGDDWGASGLGYFLASQLLWNIKADTKQLTDDFLSDCFGPAAQEMRHFYELIDGSRKYPMTADYLGRLYRTISEARLAAAGNEAVMVRLDELSQMIRYTELHLLYSTAAGNNQKTAFENLMSFTAGMRSARMVHTMGICREEKRMMNNDVGRAEPAATNWKTTPSPGREKIDEFIRDGISNNQLLNFIPVEYGDDLQFAAIKAPVKNGILEPIRNNHKFYVWSKTASDRIELTVTGGLVPHYRDRGNVRFNIYNIGGASEEGTKETLIQSDESVPPDGTPHNVTLITKQPGLHLITCSDGGDCTSIKWNPETLFVLPVENTETHPFGGTMFLYVPKGTSELGFYASLGRGKLVQPDGRTAMDFIKSKGYFKVSVPEGADGKVWTLSGISGVIRMLTVPSYFSFQSNQFILPREVIRKDNL